MTTFTQEQFNKFTPTANETIKRFNGFQPCNFDMAEAIKKVFPEFSEQDAYQFNAEWTEQR